MATTNVLTQTGNRLIVEFDGKQIGLLQSVRASDSYGLEDAVGIGDIHVQEHVPTKATHVLSVSNMVLIQQTLRSIGIAPINGDDALKGLVFDIVAYSRDSGKAVRTYVSCSYDSGDVSIDANRIVMSSAQLKALDVRDSGL